MYCTCSAPTPTGYRWNHQQAGRMDAPSTMLGPKSICLGFYDGGSTRPSRPPLSCPWLSLGRTKNHGVIDSWEQTRQQRDRQKVYRRASGHREATVGRRRACIPVRSAPLQYIQLGTVGRIPARRAMPLRLFYAIQLAKTEREVQR